MESDRNRSFPSAGIPASANGRKQAKRSITFWLLTYADFSWNQIFHNHWQQICFGLSPGGWISCWRGGRGFCAAEPPGLRFFKCLSFAAGLFCGLFSLGTSKCTLKVEPTSSGTGDDNPQEMTSEIDWHQVAGQHYKRASKFLLSGDTVDGKTVARFGGWQL